MRGPDSTGQGSVLIRARSIQFTHVLALLTTIAVWLVWWAVEQQSAALRQLGGGATIRTVMTPVYTATWKDADGITHVVNTYAGEADTQDALWELHKARVAQAKADFPPAG